MSGSTAGYESIVSRTKTIVEQLGLYGALVRRGPREFADRLRVLMEIRADRRHRGGPAYDARPWPGALDEVSRALGHDVAGYCDEPALAVIEDRVRQRVTRFEETAPHMHRLNADIALARACYIICRALKPDLVVETGVGYGVSSSFILQALQTNGRGRLESIDLPPIWPSADRFVGVLVPDELRHRWKLHKGPSQRLLPTLLRRVVPVDIFIHDSLHTYRNMLWELRTVTPYLAPRAAVLVDDVNENQAFAEWKASAAPKLAIAVSQAVKRNFFGIAVIS